MSLTVNVSKQPANKNSMRNLAFLALISQAVQLANAEDKGDVRFL